jgi:hypothetical protein
MSVKQHHSSHRKGILFLHGKAMKPYIQGTLDGLCAVYSIVNASRIISDIGDEESKVLFKNILAYLEETKGGIGKILTEGIGLTTLGSILRKVTNDKIKNKTMPFKHHPDASLNEFWNEMISFLNSGEKRAILIGLGGHMWDHWSIVHAITNRQIYFFDSYKLKILPRCRCSTTHATAARPHLLCPTHTYFLS